MYKLPVQSASSEDNRQVLEILPCSKMLSNPLYFDRICKYQSFPKMTEIRPEVVIKLSVQTMV